PPVTRDMRILEKWKMSLDFFISGHLFKYLRRQQWGEDRKRESMEDKEGEGNHKTGPRITVTISEDLPKHLEFSFDVSGTSGQVEVPPLTLKSHDKFFYFSPELCTEGESDE